MASRTQIIRIGPNTLRDVLYSPTSVALLTQIGEVRAQPLTGVATAAITKCHSLAQIGPVKARAIKR
eukprot:3463082-Pyramimonas_sp.AAC.1